MDYVKNVKNFLRKKTVKNGRIPLKRSLIFILCLLIYNIPTEAQTLKIGHVLRGIASFYGVEACRYNPDQKCPTASGRSLYDLLKEEKETGKHFAAMWNVPFGTKVKITSLENDRSVIAEIVDRGPAKRLQKRVIDLSQTSFEKLADPKKGLIDVIVEIL